MRTYEDVMRDLPKERIAKIQNRTKELIFAAELEKLRESRNISQKELAEKLSVSLPVIAAMENEPDMRLSTLKRLIEGIGGSAKLEIHFPEAEATLSTL